MYVCAYTDGVRGPMGVACPVACLPDTECPWETSYIYGHLVMAACMFFAAGMSILIWRFAGTDPEARRRGDRPGHRGAGHLTLAVGVDGRWMTGGGPQEAPESSDKQLWQTAEAGDSSSTPLLSGESTTLQ